MDTKVPLENRDNLALLYVYFTYQDICQRHDLTSMHLCVIAEVGCNLTVHPICLLLSVSNVQMFYGN